MSTLKKGRGTGTHFRRRTEGGNERWTNPTSSSQDMGLGQNLSLVRAGLHRPAQRGHHKVTFFAVSIGWKAEEREKRRVFSGNLRKKDVVES